VENAPTEYRIEDHFYGRDAAVRALYDAVLVLLGGFGPVTAEAKKTCIHVVNKTALAGVRPRKDGILLEFKTDYPIDDTRIAKTEQISKNRFHHTLKLETEDQLDETVRGWLRDSYVLSA
jgi:hypothetical protein